MVVTTFPALPAGTPIQLTAMSVGEDPPPLWQVPKGCLHGRSFAAVPSKSLFVDAFCLNILKIVGLSSGMQLPRTVKTISQLHQQEDFA